MTVLGQDTAQRANHFGGWGTATDGQTWARFGTAGTLSLVSNELKITGNANQTEIILGSLTPTDAEGLVRFQSTTTGDQPGLILRFTDANNFMVAVVTNATTLVLRKRVSGTNSQVQSVSITFAASTNYWLRFRAVGSTYFVRYWADGSAEPSTWNINGVSDTTFTSGSFGLYSNLATSSDTNQYDSFYTVDYALTDSVAGSESGSETLTQTVTDSVSISDSLPQYFPADTLTATESLLDALSDAASDSGDTLSCAETLADTCAFLPLELLNAAEIVLWSASETPAADSAPPSADLLFYDCGPQLADALSCAETVLDALALSVSSSSLTNSPFQGPVFTPSLTLSETFTESLATQTTDTLSGGETIQQALTSQGSDALTLLESLQQALADTFAPDSGLAPDDSLFAEASTLVLSDSLAGIEQLALSVALTFASENANASDVLLSTNALTFASDALSAPTESFLLGVGYVPQENMVGQESVLWAFAETLAVDALVVLDIFGAGLVQTGGDTLSSLESVSLVEAYTAPIEVVGTIADILLQTLVQTGTESAGTPSDTMTEQLGTGVVDNLSGVEAVLLALADTLSDSGDLLSSSDSSAGTTLVAAPPADTLLWGESVSLVLTLQPQESLSAQETVATAFALLGVPDVLSASESGLASGTLVPLDTLSSSDLLAVALALIDAEANTLTESLLALLAESGSDLLSSLDTLSALNSALMSGTDTVSALESLLLGTTFGPTEQLALQESDLVLVLLALPLDTAVLIDASTTMVQQSATDTAPLSDTSLVAGGFVPLDALSTAESLAYTWAENLLDTVAVLSDAILALYTIQENDATPVGLDVLLSTLTAFSTATLSVGGSHTFALLEVLADLSNASTDAFGNATDALFSFSTPNALLGTDSVAVSDVLLVTLAYNTTDAPLAITDTLSAAGAAFAFIYAYVRSGTVQAATRSGAKTLTTRTGTLTVLTR